MNVKIQFVKPPMDIHKNFISIKKRSRTDYIVVHCSATLNKADFDWKTIDRMHRQQGWLMCGYHFVIKKNGTIQNGRDIDVIGSHVKGHNDESIGICLIGGVNRNGESVDNFTEEQKNSLRMLIDWLRGIYPNAKVLGHRDFDGVVKDCPCFGVIPWYGSGAKYITIPEGMTADDIRKKYNLSVDNFKYFNGTIDVSSGDFVRVA